MQMKVAYLGGDVHAKNSVIRVMDEKGEFRGKKRFKTTEKELVAAVREVDAQKKLLAIEESTLAQWAAGVLREHVDEVVIADPRQNRLISEDPDKNDERDSGNLCLLLMLGKLKRVYHPEEDHRAVFKTAVQSYLDLRDQQIALKLKLKAMYRHWGVTGVEGTVVYGKGRTNYLAQVKQDAVKHQLARLYHLVDETEKMEASALGEVQRLGRRYPEIKRFRKVPGIGTIGSHVYDAFVQTPERFANKKKLWRYFRLGITDRSSDGKPLGYKRLDRSGIGELKALSYRAWLSGMKGDTEVRKFYQRSLESTHDHVHARLNTQRKIIAVLYGMWKKGEDYRPEVFLGS
jgi:transposase